MIDWSKTEELRNMVGSEDFHEIVSVFIEEVSAALRQLRTCPEEKAGAFFHYIKGSAANLGLEELTIYCSAREKGFSHGARSLEYAALCEVFESSKSALLKGPQQAQPQRT